MSLTPRRPRAELEAAIAQLELRITDRIDAAAWRLVALLLGVYALVIGTLVALVLFSLNILSRLPPTPAG